MLVAVEITKFAPAGSVSLRKTLALLQLDGSIALRYYLDINASQQPVKVGSQEVSSTAYMYS